ncbi:MULTISPECIES: transcriptional regulator [Actinomycetaceae]|uniref:Transcriptional regulator n=2 Tax=Actinomycetaceae TaxID=2049 RepID=A0ABZ0RAC1_9ACTO|nr:transcriptional regulator [Actinotignum sanguinis]WPJ88719.1 transcriptional regulator [Schaalia turicensis]MDE1553168.1 transcriptional regulator [Actinotignum sanguinis]MDE1566192.1 transcriptional regulator [Actinotignum sanguinis]MDE1578128.1 transcriptional regulator [Actinotignum sanguinis]MDE1641577.1 transcriptional regulator [Actinotignum sanguinis]
MTTLDTTVTRDGNWWVAEFTLNGKEYGTQARRLDQIDEMVKDTAALITGDPLDSFAVNVSVDTPEFAVNDIKR